MIFFNSLIAVFFFGCYYEWQTAYLLLQFQKRIIEMKLFEMTDERKAHFLHECRRARTSLKWVLFSLLSGVIIGLTGTGFYYLLKYVTSFRGTHPWTLFFLPVAGLLIVWMYRALHDENDTGTNLVLSAIHSGEHVPLRMAPLIVVSTLLTHLCGGSAGREGAALQLGGSIGGKLGRLFRFDEKDQHIMIMCGMSAAFSALFGTPMAAAIFAIEVVSVGIMHYAALVPCVISALTARGIAAYFGIHADQFVVSNMPAFDVRTAVITALFALLCALVSILFCVCLHRASHLFRRFIENPYLRAFTGGLIIIALTLLVGDQTYNGAGLDVIEHCFNGNAPKPAFLLKILFTAITLGAGFKGGEIVPTFFIGASFGSLFAGLFGLNNSLFAAIGMCSVFCGVTNCPISSLLISFELFGYEGMPYYLLAIALSYMLSGYYGLYSSQKIMYSKYKTSFIDRKAK